MKVKILQALKTKYKNLGFGEKAFDGVAEFLSKTVTEEADIETAVSGVEGLLKSFQGDIDKVRNEKSELQRKYDELESGSKKPEEGKDEKTSDIQALIKAGIEEAISPLKDKLSDYEVKEKLSARQGFIASKAKELGIPEWRQKEGFSISDDVDEAGITAHLTSVRQNLVTAGLEGKNEGAFSLSTPEDQQKELARDWAQSLPDA